MIRITFELNGTRDGFLELAREMEDYFKERYPDVDTIAEFVPIYYRANGREADA